MTKALMVGCEGITLKEEEEDFFAHMQPFGLILFARNIKDKAQVQRLTKQFRQCVGRPKALVFVDQEGGRVQRLSPPVWPSYPKASSFIAASSDHHVQEQAVFDRARAMAKDLVEVGIHANCFPVLDVPVAGAHDVIGDRAYAQDPREVTRLARYALKGLEAEGVLPVIKHIPGHGRACADSHEALPIVDASWEELCAWDFIPFRAFAHVPFAMTAHVVYTALDREHPATLSHHVIQEVIRGYIGFKGILMSDDLSMKALKGPLEGRAEAAWRAGCDIVLHCNGNLTEMQAIARIAGELDENPRTSLYA